jgi:hypothetical protein
MNTNPTRRVAAGAVLAAAVALIGLGTATASNAGTNSNSGSDSPTPVQTGPWYEPSGHTPYGTYQNDDKHPGHH